MKKLIILLASFAVLIGGLYFATVQAKAQPSMLITLKANEVKEKIDNGEDFSLYVYSDTCAYCKEFSPVLEGYLKENNVNIYRVATTSAQEHKAVSDMLGDKFQGTPSVFSFKSGAINDYLVGAQTKEALTKYAQKNQAIFGVVAS